jgi:hypothetical protein
MPLMTGLTTVQRESLQIVDFIFHIIDPAIEGKVVFLDEVQLQAKQKQFFLKRLQDIAEGTQYVFKENAVDLKNKCEGIIAEPGRFLEFSRQITENFAGRHEGQMSEGVFVVATVKYLLRTNVPQKLILLVKMDKKPSFSYTYSEINGRQVAVVTEVENALNETKSSIQKSAVVDVSDSFVWDVLAYDRIKQPLLGDYYKEFLGIREREVDSELTRKAFAAVKSWARRLSTEDMAPNEDAAGYIGRALNYIVDRDAFDTAGFLSAVVRDEDQARKAVLEGQLRERLVEAGVAGQRFVPRHDSIPTRQKKTIYQTKEGVMISFQGDRATAGLTVEPIDGNRKRITIVTDNLEILDR